MLLERDPFLAALNGASQQAADGHGRVVLVEGEAGVGKTTLLREFSRRAGTGAKVLWGWCEALSTPRPLGPLYDMARALDPSVAAMLDEGARPDRLFPALLDALQESTEPTTIIFEDVHWADAATLDLIKYLGRRIALLPAVLVLSMRNDETGLDHTIPTVLGDLPASILLRLTLRPLSPEGVAALAGEFGRPDAGLHRITGGNPFFVTELLAGDGDALAAVPASVRDAVWARLARLGSREREALELIAIAPGGVEPWLLEALLGPDAYAAIDGSLVRGILVRTEQQTIRFRHELARRASLDRLSKPRQRALHQRVEAALAAAAAGQSAAMLSRRVHHADGAGEGAVVLDLAPKAAAHAARLGAHQQAAAHLATALNYVDQASPELAAQLHEDWAYEAGIALQIDDATIAARSRAVELWRALGRVDKVALNLRWLSRLHWYRGEAEKAQAYVDEAVRVLEGLPPGPELAMAYGARAQMDMLHDRIDAAISGGKKAIALAEKFGEIETRVHALNTVAAAHFFSGRAGGPPMMEESLALALKHGLHEQAARAYTNYAEYAVIIKDFALAERIVSEGIAFDTRHDLDSWTHYLVGRQAQLRMEQGRFAEAETIASGVMGLERQTLVMKLPALTVLARVRMRFGSDDAPALQADALEKALATGEPQNIVPVRLGLAEAAWLEGNALAAIAQLDEIGRFDVANFDAWERGELAVWWRRCAPGKPVPAAAAKDIAAPRALEIAGSPLEAAAEWERLGLPYEAGLSLLQVDGAAAGDALARAAELFDQLGTRPAAEFARQRAEALGLADYLPKQRRGPKPATRAHPLGLSQREQQVLEMIAAGKSNKQIARDLKRSPRTVEHHVSAVLGKLGASTRMEVALRLQSEPWLAGTPAVG